MTNPMLPGGDAATFDDPLAMLSACHLRIRKQLATLARLEHHLPEHGHDDDARAAHRAVAESVDKVIGIGPLFELTGDMHADIARIQRWYAPYKGRNHDVLQPKG